MENRHRMTLTLISSFINFGIENVPIELIFIFCVEVDMVVWSQMRSAKYRNMMTSNIWPRCNDFPESSMHYLRLWNNYKGLIGHYYSLILRMWITGWIGIYPQNSLVSIWITSLFYLKWHILFLACLFFFLLDENISLIEHPAWETSITHFYCEVYQCADFLAKQKSFINFWGLFFTTYWIMLDIVEACEYEREWDDNVIYPFNFNIFIWRTTSYKNKLKHDCMCFFVKDQL